MAGQVKQTNRDRRREETANLPDTTEIMQWLVSETGQRMRVSLLRLLLRLLPIIAGHYGSSWVLNLYTKMRQKMCYSDQSTIRSRGFLFDGVSIPDMR